MTKSNRRTIRAFTNVGGTLLFTAAIALGTTPLGYPPSPVPTPTTGAAQAEAANGTSARTTSA
jgi:hypothetical protein